MALPQSIQNILKALPPWLPLVALVAASVVVGLQARSCESEPDAARLATQYSECVLTSTANALSTCVPEHGSVLDCLHDDARMAEITRHVAVICALGLVVPTPSAALDTGNGGSAGAHQ